jgi:hypothetical protein
MQILVEFGTWIRNLPRANGMPLLAIALAAISATPGSAGIVVINFEALPSLATQPNNFAAAGAAQTYSTAGVFGITGGVVLGNPLGLAGFASNGSTPNTYGTTDAADPSLLSTLVLTMPLAEQVTNVTGILFNGQPLIETYTVTAKSGATIVDSKMLSSIPASSSTSDFANFSLSSTLAQPITEVDFNAPSDINSNGWDFFVDTIRLTAVPEPSTLLMMIGAASAIGLRVWRKR